MGPSIENLRRDAKALKKAFVSGEPQAISRVQAVLADASDLKHADALHVLAREAGFDSWPKLKFAIEARAMDRADKAERLKMALFHGQHWIVEALLAEMPDLARENFGLACALYDIEFVQDALRRDPDLATKNCGIRRPLLHLCFSQHFKGSGDPGDMMSVAKALVQAGADVDDTWPFNNDPTMPLSALYGAIGHAGNMRLAEWLLQHGANPNDNESLYHATELGHCDGLRLLLKHGARPEGTNALPRALDFNDLEAVQLLLDAGADPNEGIEPHPSGEPSFVIPALHQATRRLCDPSIIGALLQAGADASRRYKDATAYATARIYGHHAAAQIFQKAGADTSLTETETLLAAAADGEQLNGRYLDTSKLPALFHDLIQTLIGQADRRAHIERLIKIGMDWDRPDGQGLTPVQLAGWEGLPEMVDYFLSLKPDLGHINGYGGTLLSTIIHGSENCPSRASRDHITCARLALEQGVALPKPAIKFAGDPDMADFLARWAAKHPGQVVEDGVW